MKYKALRAKCRITEIPIIFPDRKAGYSKMSASYFTKALADLWRIKFACIKNKTLKQMLKFAVTGGLGTLTNLALFFLFADIAKLNATAVSAGCFIIAGAQNYMLHHKWSFIENTGGTKPSFRKWLVFMASSLAGLAVNIGVLNFILASFSLPFKVIAQGCGILCGMVINFIAAKFIVFRRKK
jgi:putative flippase GtrA